MRISEDHCGVVAFLKTCRAAKHCFTRIGGGDMLLQLCEVLHGLNHGLVSGQEAEDRGAGGIGGGGRGGVVGDGGRQGGRQGGGGSGGSPVESRSCLLFLEGICHAFNGWCGNAGSGVEQGGSHSHLSAAERALHKQVRDWETGRLGD